MDWEEQLHASWRGWSLLDKLKIHNGADGKRSSQILQILLQSQQPWTSPAKANITTRGVSSACGTPVVGVGGAVAVYEAEGEALANVYMHCFGMCLTRGLQSWPAAGASW